MMTYRTPIEMKRTEDVVIERRPDGVYANVPLVGAHSYEFEYGYGGSGPAELGLSALNAFVPACADGKDAMALGDSSKLKIRHISQFAWEFHHQFADEVLGLLPREDGRYVIKANDVHQWIQQRAGREPDEQGQEQEHEESRGR